MPIISDLADSKTQRSTKRKTKEVISVSAKVVDTPQSQEC